MARRRRRKKKSNNPGAIVASMGSRRIGGPGSSVRFVVDDEEDDTSSGKGKAHDERVAEAEAAEGTTAPVNLAEEEDDEDKDFETKYGLPPWGDNVKHARFGAQNVWLATGSTESYYEQHYRTGGKGLLQYGSEAYGYNLVPMGNAYMMGSSGGGKKGGKRTAFNRRPGSGRWRPAKDNLVSANDVIETFIGLFNGTDFEKQRAAEVQQLLFEGGFYGSGKPNLGAFGQDDLDAFVRAMMGARMAGGLDLTTGSGNVGEGMPLNEFLERSSASFAAQGVADLAELNRNRKPREVFLTDNKDIEGMANAGGADSNATDILGHFLTPAQLASYQEYIHKGENKEADDVYAAEEIINLEGGTKGGDVTKAPRADFASLDAFERMTNPVEYGSHKVGMMAVQILEDFTKHSPGGTGS